MGNELWIELLEPALDGTFFFISQKVRRSAPKLFSKHNSDETNTGRWIIFGSSLFFSSTKPNVMNSVSSTASHIRPHRFFLRCPARRDSVLDCQKRYTCIACTAWLWRTTHYKSSAHLLRGLQITTPDIAFAFDNEMKLMLLSVCDIFFPLATLRSFFFSGVVAAVAIDAIVFVAAAT